MLNNTIAKQQNQQPCPKCPYKHQCRYKKGRFEYFLMKGKCLKRATRRDCDELFIKSQLCHCTPVPRLKRLVPVKEQRGRRSSPSELRTQCQFSARRHRLRNYLDKPLGVTIKTSSPPPLRLSLGLSEFIARHYDGQDKNVLLIYLVKGLRDGRFAE